MYEHRSQPPLTRVAFAARMLRHFLLAIGFVVLSLAGGMLGYVCFEIRMSTRFMMHFSMPPCCLEAWVRSTLPAHAVGRFLPVYMLCTLGFFFW